MRRASLLAVLVMLSLQAARAAPVEPRIDALCREVFQPGGPGGAVAVVWKGRVVHKQCYGLAPDSGQPVTPTTRFYLASVSKQFTATCIMILADQGKLGLGQDIRRYLPEFPVYNAKRPIRVDDLLTMRSGLQEYPMDEPSMSREKLTAYYRSVALESATGTRYEYCNGGYVLLGYIVEQVSGKSMKSFLQQNVFGPLKMTRTTFDEKDTADAGIYTCLEDMLLYEQALRKSPPVSDKMLQRAWSQARLDNGQTIGYGFGWEVSSDGDQVYHTGKWEGASTYLGLDLANGVSIIVLSGLEDTAPALAEAINELEP